MQDPTPTQDRPLRIGVVGGGQLAGMLSDACRRLGCECVVLEKDPACPAALAGADFIEGDSWDPAALGQLAEAADILTVEIEYVSTENLSRLEQSGHTVVPAVSVLELIVDKYRQKQKLADDGLPTSAFEFVPAGSTITEAPFGLPLVWKACRGGYDGRGVIIVRDPTDLPLETEQDGYIEAFVEADMEIAVMVAVNDAGETTTWSPVEMVFDTKGNLLDLLIAPARISPELEAAARQLAVDAVRAIDGTGIFGVELFVDPDGGLQINEMAPRTHNSGHFTMDAAETSQFEQQVRILTGRSLGSTAQQSPAVMINLLGALGYEGDTRVENLEKVSALPGTHVHLYGKQKCFPRRKMGHVTITGDTIDDALAIARMVKTDLIVRGEMQMDNSND